MIAILRRLRKPSESRPLEPALIDCEGHEVPVVFRHHRTARRLILRIDPEGTTAVVTVPHGVSRAMALDFAERSSEWIAGRLKSRGHNVRLHPGSHIPLRGEPHEIRHISSARGTVIVDPVERAVLVPGDIRHAPRRIADFLKSAAREELTVASRRYAEEMGARFRRISIRDQKSRWGSCSAKGDLSYSWRLILAPPYVLDYVAAHEVAHLVHMNHGRRFWRLVLTHCRDASRAKKWLKESGQSVHRYVV